jgi:hypothetical protein
VNCSTDLKKELKSSQSLAISIRYRESRVQGTRNTFCFAYLSLCEAVSPFPADRALCLIIVPLSIVCCFPVQMVGIAGAPAYLQHVGPFSTISLTRSYVLCSLPNVSKLALPLKMGSVPKVAVETVVASFIFGRTWLNSLLQDRMF